MEWGEIVAEAERVGVIAKAILQEELQKSVLTVLSRKGCFQRIVFQGGTALRLFYGNPRFSEDLDLVLRQEVPSYLLGGDLDGIGYFCSQRYPFLDGSEIRTQKRGDFLQRYVLKVWSDQVEARLHIELVKVPSYSNYSRILDDPPYNPAVRIEEATEILADKVRALAYRPYLKGRDLWDIHFLKKERSVDVDWDLVLRKIVDYSEPTEELGKRLEKAKEAILSEGKNILDREMTRFLPVPILGAYREDYDRILRTVLDTIEEYQEGRGGST